MSGEFFCTGCARMRPTDMRVKSAGRRDKCRSCAEKLAVRMGGTNEKRRLSEGRATATQYRKGRPLPGVE